MPWQPDHGSLTEEKEENAWAVLFQSAHAQLRVTAEYRQQLGLVGVLGEVAVADILSFCHMFGKTGQLQFSLQEGQKSLFFHEGVLVWAASDLPQDEFGEWLCRWDRISRAQLLQLQQQQTTDKPLGRLLVEFGLFTPKQLWQITQEHVQQLIWQLLDNRGGGFTFWHGPVAEKVPLRLSLDTQNLIIDGLRRMDEVNLYRRRVGSWSARVELVCEPDTAWPRSAWKLLQMVQQGHDRVADLVCRSGYAEKLVLELLWQLKEAGWIAFHAEPVAWTETQRQVVTVFNGSLQALWRQVSPRFPQLQQELNQFISRLPSPYGDILASTRVQDDGTLDTSGLQFNLQSMAPQEQAALLADALGEVVYHACLIARRELGEEPVRPFVQRVQSISRRARRWVQDQQE